MNENTIIENKVYAINCLHKAINLVAPKIIDRLKKGFKCKNDNSLFEKDAKDIRCIIEDIKKTEKIKIYSCFIDSNAYSITLKAKETYKTGEYSCNYIEKSVWLCSKLENPENFTFEILESNLTVSQYMQIFEKIKSNEEKIDHLRREIILSKFYTYN